MTNDNNILTKTNDGYVVEIFAKVQKKIEKEMENIAEGITILNTEIKKTEEEQFTIYQEIVDKMEDRPVIIKTTEKGKDTATLKVQLRALLRAAQYGDVSIAFPKISTVTELIQFKELIEECKNELDAEKIPYKKHIKLGAVVEIPSAALMSYELARECDFLFIETNSLINYTFGGSQNTSQTQKFQSVIIKLIRHATQGAHDAGIFCGISGAIVEDELYLPLLIGLGIDEFSMETSSILETRKLISELDRSDCKELAKEVLQLSSIEEIENKLKKFKRN